MLIQLAGCHRHPPSHFASWFTYSLSLSLSLAFHFCMQAVSLELRKSSFDSHWAVLIYSRVIRQYFSQLSSLPPSIHPSVHSLTLDDTLKKGDVLKEKVLHLGLNNAPSWCDVHYIFSVLFVLVESKRPKVCRETACVSASIYIFEMSLSKAPNLKVINANLTSHKCM